MDNEPKQKNFDWAGKYLQHLQDQKIHTASPEMADFMANHDSFLPDTLDQFQEDDLDRMFRVGDLVHQMAQKNGFYLLYSQLIQKMTALLLEQFPEKYEVLPPERKDRIFGTKIELPTERDLYDKLYVYLLGQENLPPDMINTGVTLRALLERLMTTNPEIIDQRLIDLICTVDGQYSDYYGDFLHNY